MPAERQEPDRPTLSAELKGTEALFAALRPATPTIDRDRVMYEAGLAAARREHAPPEAMRRGPALRHAVQFAALAASLLVGLWIGERRTRYEPRAESIVNVEGSESIGAGEAPRPVSLPVDSYGELRKHLATADLDTPIRTSERSGVVPEAMMWRDRRDELLRTLN
jgi:anti-sigma factor RsiW